MDLSRLPVQQGFRLRGEAVTRLETFVDAAFAFAVTLLVVSFEAMPDSFAELYDALRRLPTFLAGFAIVAMFWQSHHRFSRRFGLEDGMVTFLSLVLVAVALFYVYPLRMVMSAAMRYFTLGWAPSEFQVQSFLEFRLIFVIYGVGFAALALVVVLLNVHALRRAALLRLDAAEVLATRAEIVSHLLLAGCAGLSIALALLISPERGWQQALPGLSYALLAIVMPWYGTRVGRRIDALVAVRPSQVRA
jgi:hypothetical protein